MNYFYSLLFLKLHYLVDNSVNSNSKHFLNADVFI